MKIYSEPIETEKAVYRYNYFLRYPITPEAWESCPGYWADLAESKM